MRYSEEIKQQARELCAHGLSRREVGRRLGIPPETVGKWVNPEVAERQRELTRRWRQENPERQREYGRRWYEENLEYCLEQSRQWRDKNPEYRRQRYEKNKERELENNRRWQQENTERVRENNRRWYQENPERAREHNRRWKRENPERHREHSSHRRACQEDATPLWLTPEHREQMTALHAEARRLEQQTGVKHHVDHIIPLAAKARFNGKYQQVACGLHVPWNLRVLSGPDNCSKWCKLPGPEDWTA